MQGLRTTAPGRGTRLALAAVAVALFGLMSMHGWGSHVGAHPMGAPESAGVMVFMDHDGLHASDLATASDSSAGQQTQVPADDEEGGGLLGLCLAILTGLVVGIALTLARRGIRVLRSLLPAWPSPALYGRDRDPPDLLRLCVIRC
ncbi:DUF6153 family protein [Nocardioides sp. NBC_00368]|uniref:DUF6153 family protein n=1 Tax=Nocardioides sp. NBC_00368 TaxID=2976000 RepID=UPI002E21FB47